MGVTGHTISIAAVDHITPVLAVATEALARITADEVLTNCGSVADTGRWLRAIATIESHEDFNEFPGARTETPCAMGGNGAPADPDAGASLEAA